MATPSSEPADDSNPPDVDSMTADEAPKSAQSQGALLEDCSASDQQGFKHEADCNSQTIDVPNKLIHLLWQGWHIAWLVKDCTRGV